MSDVPDILHEDDVRAVIQDEIEKTVGADNAAIDDLTAAGATYDQTHSNTIVDAVNAILAALRANGIIAESVGGGY